MVRGRVDLAKYRGEAVVSRDSNIRGWVFVRL
jgi:hypothetical protein